MLSTWLLRKNIVVNVKEIDEYATIDDQVLVAEIPSDQTILQKFREEDEKNTDSEEEEETEDVAEQITAKEAILALDKLSRFYETNLMKDDFFYHYSQLKRIVSDFYIENNFKKQTVITQYFKKS